MSKRSQTTGKPKGGQPPAPPSASQTGRRAPRLLAEYDSKRERDRAIQRLIIFATGAVIGIATIVLVVLLIIDQFVVPAQAVANVNGQTISVADFQKRVRLERFLLVQRVNSTVELYRGFGFTDDQINQQLTQDPTFSAFLNELNVPDQLGNRVINDMVRELLIRQEAARRGISVSQADVQKRLYEFFSYNPDQDLITPTATITPSVTPTPFVSPTPSPTRTNTPEPSPTPTLEPSLTITPTLTAVASATPTNTPNATERADQFTTRRNDYYAAVRRDTGISDDDINAYFEMQVLTEALRDAVTADLPRTTTYYSVRHILVDSETKANHVIAALQSGESFAALAAALSSDTSNKDNGGELGWAPATNYVDPFRDAVINAEIGAVVGPVQTQFGYHVLQVRGREDRTMTDSEYDTAKNREFSTFVDSLRTAAGSSVQIFETWADNIPSF